MKTFSKILLGLFLAIAMTCFMAPNAGAQWCDSDVPNGGILPHPDNTAHTAKIVYQTTQRIVYQDLKCGTNDIIHVDPCDPWVLTFYIGFWEHHFANDSDQVKLRAPQWNWNDSNCQYVNFEYIWPPNYDTSMYVDSAVIKVTMWPHEIEGCPHINPYTCYWGNVVYPDCWDTCMHERLTFEAIDSCEVPNSAICRIEFDKPLPVELKSFTSTVSGNNAILNWTTAKETNNSGFAVERYAEGIWTEVGFVKGNGTTSLPVDYTYTDKNLNSGLYGYRLKQVDFNGNFEYLDLNGMVAIGSPDRFTLSQNYPNPFNPTTTIVYGIPNNGPVTLKVYDNLGREVRTLVNEPKTAGFYTLTFSAPDLSSGVYFYKLESGNFVTVKRMILMK